MAISLVRLVAIVAFGLMAFVVPARAQERTVVELAHGWRFKLDNRLDHAAAAAADDGWEQVEVPHSWNRVGYYLPNPQQHIHRKEAVDSRQGVGWYRLAFTPPRQVAGRRLWLEFDAASRVATVWLNGIRLGEHRGGFSRFRFDATAALRPDASNLLVVSTDNRQPAPGSPTAGALPLAGDFFIHGGLYRSVRLVATDTVHVDMLDHGGPGVYAATRSIARGRATIDVRSRLRNDGTVSAPVELVTRLIDRQGRVAAERVRRAEIAPASGMEVDQQLIVTNPHLWQGVADPYLYRLVTEVRSIEDGVCDRLEQQFGIREMRIDPARGFFLNGKPYPLRGVGYHQDREGKGWAIGRADVEQDVALLREMGANSIRLTHYQHGSAIHEIADRVGLILWDEIPLVTLWTYGEDQQPAPEIRQNARDQLVELIRQNRNHAAVAVWGIANEVDFGNSLTGFLTGYRKSPPDPMPLLAELHALARAEDAGRPTALATCCEGRLFSTGVEVPVTAPAATLGGANRYFGWYYGKPEDLGPHLDALHAERPGQPLSVTEYGAGGALTVHTDNVLGGPVEARGRAQPEEYESWFHERNWAVLSARPYLWGTWLWNSFDFASTVRREGDAQDINTKGLISYDRTVRKDAYYFYKANWTATPTVHVNGRRYVDRAYPVTQVRVYSNAGATELFVNGRSLGIRTQCPQRTCIWDGVRLQPGGNVVRAQGRFGHKRVSDSIEWRLAPEAVNRIRIDSGALVAAPSAAGRFGSDEFFVGGEPATVNTPAGLGRGAQTRAIAGTDDDTLVATYRRGSFRYRVPLANGRYTVVLSFVEPSLVAGERSFDVIAQGFARIRDLDIAGEAHGSLILVKRRIEAPVTDGWLELAFVPRRGEAIVSAIEIRPSSDLSQSD